MVLYFRVLGDARAERRMCSKRESMALLGFGCGWPSPIPDLPCCMILLSFDRGDQVVVASTFELGEDILGRTELTLIKRIRVSCKDGLKNLRSPIRDVQTCNALEDASPPPVYLSKPAPGFVGELARVVADEIVPEAAVRLHEPLAGVDDAMIRPPPLLLPGAFRRASLRPSSSPMRSISCMDMNVAGEDRTRSSIGVIIAKRTASYVADPFCHHEHVMHDASIIKVCVTHVAGLPVKRRREAKHRFDRSSVSGHQVRTSADQKYCTAKIFTEVGRQGDVRDGQVEKKLENAFLVGQKLHLPPCSPCKGRQGT
uniref:Uncharacterized protein n=1 Tax=Oryza glumipatula TaxID=40148 RepID=A0A0D9ZRU0_9ORYZ